MCPSPKSQKIPKIFLKNPFQPAVMLPRPLPLRGLLRKSLSIFCHVFRQNVASHPLLSLSLVSKFQYFDHISTHIFLLTHDPNLFPGRRMLRLRNRIDTWEINRLGKQTLCPGLVRDATSLGVCLQGRVCVKARLAWL